MEKINFASMNFLGFQLTSTKQFPDKASIEQVLDMAKTMEPYAHGEKYTDVLKDKVVATLFYEPSTRTKLSFQTAALRLGAKVISETGLQFSSLYKGETMEDTMRMVEQYADLIVMRHPEKGSSDLACTATKRPFLNAGDGPGQHPTQALLDMYTIRKEKGKIDGLKIALVGDLKYGRTVHSLCFLLKFYDVELVFVSPDELRMPTKVTEELQKQGVKFSEVHSLDAALPVADVIYMTRVQEERFENKDDFLRLKDSFILTSELLEHAKKDVTIMHPLPRLNEIATSVDAHPGAAYFRQAGNGLPIRMALIAMLLGREKSL